MNAQRFAKQDAVIDNVRNLVAGDQVRDFYTADPTFGVVVEVTADAAVIQWDGDTAPKAHPRKGGGALIRAKRDGELKVGGRVAQAIADGDDYLTESEGLGLVPDESAV